jgi:hypothetical protein
MCRSGWSGDSRGAPGRASRRVGALAGEQGGPRARADRGGTEGLAEEHALVGQVLDVRCRDRIPVGLHIAAGVVRVEIEDVWSHSSLS